MLVEQNSDVIKPSRLPSPVRVIAVTGGKGGIGKSSISINLALALIATGKRVMLMDADLGLANIDVMLGLDAVYDISHVLSGERVLDEVILEGPNGLKIIPASSGISRMAALSQAEQAGLIHAFGEMADIPDVFIVDTAAGIGPSVCSFCAATQEVVVVLTEEPAAITDAYAQIKLLWREYGLRDFHVLANMADSHQAGRELFNKLERVASRYLQVNLNYFGVVPYDQTMRDSGLRQRTSTQQFPNSPAAMAFRQLANTANNWPWREGGAATRLEFFLERVLHTNQRFVG
ncbi:MAG: MinD/ParA family protein [Immundisolibacteraceae bacterium]|nr:MinD/ParA family protein [Immundisolibacteraceae bacterium]